MSAKMVKPVDDAVREQYNKEFDSKWYVNTFFKDVWPDEEIVLTKLNEIFTQDKLKGPIKRCIDIGCGPIVHRLSAASKVCESLVYSDFSSQNRKFVQEWLDGPENDHDHLNLFKICAKLEEFDDLEKGAKVIANRIKSKVEGVEPINVLIANPIGQLDKPFDVAFTSACLESACDSYESFVTAVKNIATILRPGGYLLMKSFLGCTFYKVKDVQFPCLPLSVEMVKKGLKEAGYEVQEIEIVGEKIEVEEQTIDGIEYSDCTGSFFAVARKLSQG